MNIQLKIHADLNAIPRNTASQRIVELVVNAPQAPRRTERLRLNIALVLDRSGSMSGGKLEHAKQAAQHVLNMLQPEDRVSVIAFDDQLYVVGPASPAYPATIAEYIRRVGQLECGGSTFLHGGWAAGAQEVSSADAGPGWLNRVLLLTDGQANVGPTDPEILAGHAGQLSLRGISTSTFGLGHGFNEHLLEAMANQGGGNFYYIAGPDQIPAVFQTEFNEIAAVTAHKTELVVDLPAGTSAQVLGDYRTEQHGQQVHIYLGDLNSRRELPVYLKLLLPPANAQHADALKVGACVQAIGLEEAALTAQAELALAYGDDDQVHAMPVDRPLMERYAVVDVAQTTNEALKLERAGKRKEASELVKRSVLENRDYMASPQVSDAGFLADRLEHGMDEWDRKDTHSRNYNIRKQRPQQ